MSQTLYTPDWVKAATKDIVFGINQILSVIPDQIRAQTLGKVPPGSLTRVVESALGKHAPKAPEPKPAAPTPQSEVAPVLPVSRTVESAPEPLSIIREALTKGSLRLGQAAELLQSDTATVSALIAESGDLEVVKPGWIRKKV